MRSLDLNQKSNYPTQLFKLFEYLKIEDSVWVNNLRIKTNYTCFSGAAIPPNCLFPISVL